MKIPRYSAKLACCIVLAASVSISTYAVAQQFPSKPIHIIVPLGAASSTDISARLLAASITEETGQSVVVENRTGAEGAIGVKSVAMAAADGYTVLLSTSSTQVINTHLYKNLPYDPIKDFVAVTPLFTVPLVLWVNSDAPLNSVNDVLRRAKQEPGKLTFGSSTATMRLSGEMFKQRAGVQMTNVPYRSTVAALTDLVAGRIDVVFTDAASASAHVAGKRVRPLAAMVNSRMSSLPELPTIAETGVQGYNLTVFFGVWVPANTPAPIVAKLNSLFANAMKSPRLREMLTKSGAEAMAMSPEEFSKFQISEIEKLRPVVKAAGIEMQ